MAARSVVVLLAIVLAGAVTSRGDAARPGIPEAVTALIDGDLGAAAGEPATADIGALIISTSTMSPTLGVGDRVLVDRSAYRSESPAAGDVVAFRLSPATAAACGGRAGEVAVKRVIGVAGDAVSAGPDGVTVNGTPRSVAGARPPSRRRDFPPVPAGSLIVMGDDGPASCDSVLWPEPFLATTEVVGRVEGVYAPRDHAGLLLPTGGIQRRHPSGPLRDRLDAILEVGRATRAVEDRVRRPYVCSIIDTGDCRRRLAASLGDVVRQERARLRAHVAALSAGCGAGALRALRRDLGRDNRALLDPARPLARVVRALEVHHVRAIADIAACSEGAGGPAVGVLR